MEGTLILIYTAFPFVLIASVLNDIFSNNTQSKFDLGMVEKGNFTDYLLVFLKKAIKVFFETVMVCTVLAAFVALYNISFKVDFLFSNDFYLILLSVALIYSIVEVKK